MKRKLSIALALCLALCLCLGGVGQAARKVKPLSEQLADRDVIETPQERAIRLGEDGKARVIITSDLEIDDMNSFIHQSLFFNEIDLEGVVVSASFCHFTGDGEHTQGEVEDHITNREEGALEMTSFRPQPLDWLPNLWNNEYAEAYEFLSQNAEGYPSPEYLTSITKIGNVQFEGDTREDTEGSDFIKAMILDDDERSLFILTWGGFNTVARALISIHEEYGETDEWDAIYRKVCDKVIICGNGQDCTYEDFVKPVYPDLVLASPGNGYPGYSAALTGQWDCLYTFQADWLKENIKFDHGSLMGIYKLVNDGQHLEGEEDRFQFGETNIVYDKEYNDYDYIAEGDSIWITGLYPVGLRTFENGAFGSYSGRYTYRKADGSDAGYPTTIGGGIVPGWYVNPQTNAIDKYNPFLLDFQMEWAARADWCVNTPENCNHAPVISDVTPDAVVAPGGSLELSAGIADPDGDDCTATWWTEATGCAYSGADPARSIWSADGPQATFTVPEDAQPGDCFILTLTVRDTATAPMTRYAQVMVRVG